MNAMLFLINTIGTLYLSVVLLRLWLQMARADFYNPLSQFVVKATQPVVGPLRRLIPSIGRLDTATLVFAYLVATIFTSIMVIVQNGMPPFWILLQVGLIKLISQIYWIIFIVLILRAILSWISQGNNPIEYVLIQLTDPLVRPIRKVIPPIGGLDLSILFLIIGLQFVGFLINDFFGPII